MFSQFKYYFTEEDGRSIYRNGNVVTSTGIHRPQGLTSDGWQEIQLAWERNMQKYYGLTRNFSLPLKFFGESAFILKHEITKVNLERKIYLLLQELALEYGPTFYKFIYKYLYKGQLDLSTFKGSEDMAECNIMEGGLQKKFKNGENTTQTIPFDDESIDIFMDGILITGKYTWTLIDRSSGLTGYPISMILKVNEQKAPGIAVFDVVGGEPLIWSAIDANRSDYFLADSIPPENGTGIFTGTIKMSDPDPSFPANIQLHIFNVESNTKRAIVPLFVGPEAAEIPINISVTIQKGDRFFLEIDEHTFESELTLEIATKNTATTIQAYKPYDAYRRLAGGMTGNRDDAQSNLLIANQNLALTCGDAIRGIKTATLKTSFSDFFEDYAITTFAGLSIDNGKMKIEDRATFFDTSNPIPLGKVKNHEWSEATDLLGNLYKIGSLKPEIDDVNGKFDPNGSANFSNPLESIPKDIDLVGPYKKGPYEIEMLRINLEGKTTTDDSSDNQCFVIDVKEIPPITHVVSFIAAAKTFSSGDELPFKIGMRVKITGTVSNDQKLTIIGLFQTFGTYFYLTDGTIVDESTVNATFILPHILNRDPVVTAPVDVCPSPTTIFNVALTPKNLLFKQERWIHSQMHGFDSEKLKWKFSDKLSQFSAIVNGRIIDEDRDEDISSLGPKLFLPFYHDFEALAPVSYQGMSLVDLLEANPNRCFEFETEEGTFLGFNVKAGYAPNTLAAQQFKLLSAPTNDLTLLIN